MAEPTTGNELKVRIIELPVIDTTTIAGGHRVGVDHEELGAGQASLRTITSKGIEQLSQEEFPSGGFAPSQNPRIPILADGFTKTYPFDAVLGNTAIFYLGPKETHPILDNQGLPLVVGSTYFNTLDGITYVFNAAGQWVPITSGSPAGVRAYYYFASIPGTVIPPTGPGTPDVNGRVLEFSLTGGQASRDSITVYINGVMQVNGADYTLVEGTAGAGDYISVPSGFCAGAAIVVQKFGLPGVLFAAGAVKANTSGWIFNGTQASFPLVDNAATPIIPGSAVNCMVVSSGRVLEPGVDFNVAGSTITFSPAPAISDDIFVVVGIPVSDGTTLDPPDPLEAPDVATLTNAINALNVQVASMNAQLTVLSTAVSDLTDRVEALEGA